MKARLIVTLALTAAALPAAAQVPRSPSNQTVVASQPVQVRDSLVFKQSMQQLLSTLRLLSAREESLAVALRSNPETPESERLRLIADLQRTARERFRVMSLLEQGCTAERGVAPAGYLGVNLNSSVQLGDGRVRLRNTIVTSVEPGSPAERAGIIAGDSVIAIAGRDFVNDLPALNDVLIPGRKLPVALRREGKPLELALVVAARPEGFNRDCGQFERVLAPLKVGARLPAIERRRIEGERIHVREPLIGGAAPEEVRIMVFAPDPAGMTSVGYFAGAELRQLDADWRKLLRIKEATAGVVVSEVAPGSAAANAGLKKFDVVTTIGSSPATSPAVMIRLLSLTEGDDAQLTVLRDREARKITIRLAP